LSKEDIKGLIEQLGSKHFAERESATRALLSAGGIIHPELINALSDIDDPEVLMRLRKILNATRR